MIKDNYSLNVAGGKRAGSLVHYVDINVNTHFLLGVVFIFSGSVWKETYLELHAVYLN